MVSYKKHKDVHIFRKAAAYSVIFGHKPPRSWWNWNMNMKKDAVHSNTNKWMCRSAVSKDNVHSVVHTAASLAHIYFSNPDVNWGEKKGKVSNRVQQAAGLWMYWQTSGVDSGLVINMRVRGVTIKCALCVCVWVCVWVARGVRVNWCCVLKGVNKAGECPRSSCETHTHTHTQAHTESDRQPATSLQQHLSHDATFC